MVVNVWQGFQPVGYYECPGWTLPADIMDNEKLKLSPPLPSPADKKQEVKLSAMPWVLHITSVLRN